MEKGIKQVSGVSLREREFNTMMIACINALGNSVSPYFVFPKVHFKEHMLHGAPPVSDGAGNPSGWSNLEIFTQFLEHFINHLKKKCC